MVDTPERPIGPISRAVEQALAAFAHTMELQATPKDGVLTARVVGEFSAGKTRLLRELLSDTLPEVLFPVSSMERQTRLQLEITYGTAPLLTLIERPFDYSTAVELQRCERFPERHELSGFEPRQHRLRLTVPDTRLILPNGDNYTSDDSAKRLFLIDTPGWNSGDDEMADDDAASLLTGHHNLSLVYVTQAGRLDGALNAERLKDFLEAFENADFVDRHSLVMVITHCPQTETEHLRTRAKERLLMYWDALGRDREELMLSVLCVDFKDISDAQRHEFRQDFWAALLAPLNENPSRSMEIGAGNDPWVAALRHQASNWTLVVGLEQTYGLIGAARNLMSRAIKDGQFIAGMNRYRLMGLDTQAAQAWLRQMWWRQLGWASEEPLQLTTQLTTPDDSHPLSTWWRDYWQVGLDTCLGPVVDFFNKMDSLINGLDSNTEDIQAVLKTGLAEHHQAALNALESSFMRLVETTQQHVMALPIERATATLLTLSLLEARYRDHYNQAQKSAA